MDERRFYSSTVSVVIYSALLWIAFVATFAAYLKILGQDVDEFPFVFALSSFILPLIFLTPYLYLKIQKYCDYKLFTKGKFDPEKMIFMLSRIMIEQTDIRTIADMILKTLTEQMWISKAALLTISKHKISGVFQIGYPDINFTDPEFEKLMHKMIEIGIRPFVLETSEDEEVKTLFSKYGISASMPIRIGIKEVAVLLLGRKLSGEKFSDHDLTVLGILAGNVAVAFENAESYKKLKRFNEELEKKISERTAELKLVQANEIQKAKDIAKLKDEFVFVAAHELRTPVTIIKGFLELVSGGLEKFPKDVKQNLIAVSVAAEHLNRLIEDLLEIANSESGSLKLNLKKHDIVPLIETAASQLSLTAKEKRIELNTIINRKSVLAYCDPSKLTEVMQNLLSNAIKYNRDGGKVDIVVIPGNEFLVIEVRDTGYGISKEKQADIFKKFYRVQPEEAANVTGTGLGLFLTRMLVEKMGGKIMFSSVEHKGSTFSFTIPAAK